MKELMGDLAGDCFQKPRRGHGHSSAMPSALDMNVLSEGFLACLLYFGKTSCYYVVCNAFIQVSSCKKTKQNCLFSLF